MTVCGAFREESSNLASNPQMLSFASAMRKPDVSPTFTYPSGDSALSA